MQLDSPYMIFYLSSIVVVTMSLSCTISEILLIGPILWGHGGPLCHSLSLLLWTSILHWHSPGVAAVARRLRYSYSWFRLILVVVSTVATSGEWQCKIRTGGVRRLAVASGSNIFQMLLVFENLKTSRWLSGRTSVFPCPAPDLQLTGDHSRG